MLGERATFGAAMAEIAHEYDNLMVITADFTRSSGLNKFSAENPDKFLNIGIAEQNLIGVASGLASEGYNVFATSFASFITTRCNEQVKLHCGYMRHNIKVVGLAAGFGVAQQGNTHYGLEDLSLMRAIPNMTILAPADCTEVYKVVEAACKFEGPMYIRLCGEANNPVVYSEDYDFTIGKAIQLREGDDVTIIASGTMVYQSLQAANLLAEKGIECSVIDMHTIKPLDTNAIDGACKKSKLIVTVEEGSIIGGLGSAVAEYKCRIPNSPCQLIVGVEDTFLHPGSYAYMLNQTGLDASSIATKIENKFKEI